MISVLMPAYNAASFLETSVRSILAQAVDDLEIVICDDGSTDATAAVCAALAVGEPRIRFFTQPNTGASVARNATFKRARGEFVMFLDADDFLAPDTLRPMYDLAKQNPNDAVYCRWCKFWNEPTQLEAGSTALRGDMPGWLWILRAFEHDYPTYPGSFLFPRALISRQGGWDPSLSFQDDMEFAARIISNVGTIRFCPEATFCYRQDAPGSLSKRADRRSSESHLRATSKAVDHLLRVMDTPKTRAAGARQLMLVSHAQCFAAPDISHGAEDIARHLNSRAVRTWLKGGSIRRVLQALFGWRLALAIHTHLRVLLSTSVSHR